jgi:cyclopropane fatty-acyl-phospholipid synthase-like methyltransferase
MTDEAWHDDDRFWQAAASSLFDDAAWASAAADAELLAELLELEPGSTVLDLGCGPGRYAIPLARLGFQVVGVDRTRAFLDAAAERAAAAGVEVELVPADMREFRRPEAFHAVLSMLTSFGYFEDPAEDLRVLRNALAGLRPGGALLIDTMGKEILGRIFQARDWKIQGEETWLFERRPTRSWSWMENTWIRIHETRGVPAGSPAVLSARAGGPHPGSRVRDR